MFTLSPILIIIPTLKTMILIPPLFQLQNMNWTNLLLLLSLLVLINCRLKEPPQQKNCCSMQNELEWKRPIRWAPNVVMQDFHRSIVTSAKASFCFYGTYPSCVIVSVFLETNVFSVKHHYLAQIHMFYLVDFGNPRNMIHRDYQEILVHKRTAFPGRHLQCREKLLERLTLHLTRILAF